MSDPGNQSAADSPAAPPIQDQGKRVNVVFSNDTYETLQKIASSQNISISDALRQAIGVSNLVVSANNDPKSRILIETGGKVQELKLIR